MLELLDKSKKVEEINEKEKIIEFFVDLEEKYLIENKIHEKESMKNTLYVYLELKWFDSELIKQVKHFSDGFINIYRDIRKENKYGYTNPIVNKNGLVFSYVYDLEMDFWVDCICLGHYHGDNSYYFEFLYLKDELLKIHKVE